MNLPFGVPVSTGPGRLKAGLRTDGTTQKAHGPNPCAKSERGLSMKRNLQIRMTNY